MKKRITFCALSLLSVFQVSAQCPNASFTTTAPACDATNISFTNTSGNTGGGWTYFWDFSYPLQGDASSSTSTTQNPTGVNYTPGGNGVYTVAFTITNAGLGCSSTMLMDIDIERARADFMTSASNLCVGDSLMIYNLGTPGSSPTASVVHSWSFGAGATPSTSSAVNPPAVTYTTSGAKTITHLVTVNYGGCGGLRTDVFTETISVNSSPTLSFTSDAPACIDDAVSFTYSGSPAVSYAWDFGSGATPQTSLAQNPSGITYNSSGTKTITLSAVNSYGCSTESTSTISIDALPIADAGLDTTICANSSVSIGSATVAGNTYLWFPSSTLDDETISSPTASPLASITNYLVTVTNTATGCSNSDSVQVTMLDPLNANAGVDGEICFGDSFQIGTGLIEGQNYTWTATTGLSDATSSNPVATPVSTTTYTLSVTGSGCGPETDEVTIIVNPLPLANAGIDDSITTGSYTQLIATGGVQYSWSPSYNLDNIGVFNPVATPDSTTTYIVTVTDIYGCVNTDTVVVIVIAPSFWLPSGFTPDANGNNDVLYVRGEGITEFKFSIFNKWGELIFYTENLETGWNGNRQISNDEMPVGAYVYHVSGVLSNGEPALAKGIINLIR